MKNYRWLTLIAAVLITACEVLVFNSDTARSPQKQADVAALAGVDSDNQSPGG